MGKERKFKIHLTLTTQLKFTQRVGNLQVTQQMGERKKVQDSSYLSNPAEIAVIPMQK